ncbi:hypothetical protein [Ruixingdingia sedimenti]|uniref:Uncharacterized protein n=1 Tax=Ruixingdingia sedimenti TaxID=3073604 RepID=A0ABU1FCJ7_9RHOB|nr:hypothetical protein [Xinfangfangia sp. LG-4]MDR5654189.1 hypothetical protein [Xinfangfangia sp. LG-4]
MTGTDLRRRLAGLALALWLPLAAQGQDAGLALDEGLPDLALFTLGQAGGQVSPLGHALLREQGFLHDPAARGRVRALSRGQSLVPVLRHAANVNDGIPADSFTIGGLEFTVSAAARAKDAVLMGLRHTRWRTFTYAPGARLTVAGSLTAEAEPAHGFHRLDLSLRACAEQPAARWTWIDACIQTRWENDSLAISRGATATLGPRMVFASRFGHHRLTLSPGREAIDGGQRTVIQISLATLTAGKGLWTLHAMRGGAVAGRNTVLHAFGIGWAGQVAGRRIGLSASREATGGGAFFGIPREDRVTRLRLTLPLGRVEIGGYAERRRSSVAAYEGTDLGVTLGFRMDLLAGRRAARRPAL